MSVLICNGCGERFAGEAHGEGVEFDLHNCPAIPEPIRGESFEDYEVRCAVSIAAWKAKGVQA